MQIKGIKSFTVWAAVMLVLSAVAGVFFLFDMDFSSSAAPGQGASVPILMYHSVREKPLTLAELSVRPCDFEQQVKYLIENGYTTITFEDFGRLSEIDKPIMLTFDDGYRDNYTEMFPILKKYNAKATVFVIASSIGRGGMRPEQIKEMSDSGLVSIQSHTYSHKHLLFAGDDELDYEFGKAVSVIEGITGKKVIALAYPNGECNDRIIKAASGHYEYAVVKRKGYYREGASPQNIRRIRISRRMSLWRFAKIISEAGQ